jgi:hypothetical protein
MSWRSNERTGLILGIEIVEIHVVTMREFAGHLYGLNPLESGSHIYKPNLLIPSPVAPYHLAPLLFFSRGRRGSVAIR